MGYRESGLEGRLRQLEGKIELLLVIAKQGLELLAADQPERQKAEAKERLKELDGAIKSAVTCRYTGYRDEDEQYQELEKRATGVKVFGVDVDNDGKFRFSPDYWDYPVGTSVQWVSKTGAFTVYVDPEDYPKELGSPFEQQREIQSRKDPTDNIWKTDVLQVRSLFSDTERTARRIAGAPRVTHRFTVALSKGDQIFVNRSQNGGEC